MRVNQRTVDDDKLSRDREVELIRKFIVNAKGPYVLSIDGPWGTGKTFFTKLVFEKLKDEFQAIYINAWESDYSTDPLITLISEFKSFASEDRLEKLTGKFFQLSKLVLPSAIRVASQGLISVDNLGEELSRIGESYLMNRINNYEKEKSSVSEIKSELEKSAEEALGGKVIIFIDELDRCRPDYAISLLERVKHFFEVPGLIFVLSVDEEQLSESIKVQYGGSFDTRKYLNRFIDFKFSLTTQISREFIEDSLSRIGLSDFIRNRQGLGFNRLQDMISIIEYLSNNLSLGARDVDQIIAKLNIRLLSIDIGKRIVSLDVLIILLFIEHFDKSLFNSFINFDCSPDEVINTFQLLDDKFDEYGDPSLLNSYIVGLILLQYLKGKNNSGILENFKTISTIKDSDDLIAKSQKSEIEYAKRVLRVIDDYTINTMKHAVRQLQDSL